MRTKRQPVLSNTTKSYEQGLKDGMQRLALAVDDLYESTHNHPFKIGDCALAKLNQIPKKKIRKRSIGIFTGLFDINSIPIYEGDILERLFKDNLGGTGQTYKVVYSAPSFRLHGFNHKDEFYPWDAGCKQTYFIRLKSKYQKAKS